jgi:hypothetical protein
MKMKSLLGTSSDFFHEIRKPSLRSNPITKWVTMISQKKLGHIFRQGIIQIGMDEN